MFVNCVSGEHREKYRNEYTDLNKYILGILDIDLGIANYANEYFADPAVRGALA